MKRAAKTTSAPPRPLIVVELLAELQALVRENPLIAGFPVVLAINPEGVRAKPATSDTPVCTAGYLTGGDLAGEIENCVVIWPAE